MSKDRYSGKVLRSGGLAWAGDGVETPITRQQRRQGGRQKSRTLHRNDGSTRQERRIVLREYKKQERRENLRAWSVYAKSEIKGVGRSVRKVREAMTTTSSQDAD